PNFASWIDSRPFSKRSLMVWTDPPSFPELDRTNRQMTTVTTTEVRIFLIIIVIDYRLIIRPLVSVFARVVGGQNFNVDHLRLAIIEDFQTVGTPGDNVIPDITIALSRIHL